jgi:formylglycine-generating enzyme required for sulfatase activity
VLLPWSSVSWTTADAACRAAGMRLCKVTRNNDAIVSDEWGFACSLGKSCGDACFPYGDSYNSALCNGADISQGAARPVGASNTCATSGDLDPVSTGEAVFDLSGNLAEWTNDLRGTLADGRKVHTCRGGSYDTYSFGLGCNFTSTMLAEDFLFPDTGFRCCSSCGPGLADCNGTCLNLAADSANCGACGTTCTAPATCRNGACK